MRLGKWVQQLFRVIYLGLLRAFLISFLSLLLLLDVLLLSSFSRIVLKLQLLNFLVQVRYDISDEYASF